MTAPAGFCVGCGGPQQWTFHRGEMLVRCVRGCLPLFEVFVAPPDSEEDADPTAVTEEWWELMLGGGVESCEGCGAEE